MRRGLLVLALLGSLTACGMSDGDEALCRRVQKINPYMDTNTMTGSHRTSAKSVMTALQGADDEDLAQVGRDYLAAGADVFQLQDYQDRAAEICD